MDGFTGFKTATAEELPDAVAVMDPFHVVRLAGDALDRCRRRVQQDLHGHRGRRTDPLYRSRRTLHTGSALLTEKQRTRLHALLANDDHVQVEATWGIYQRMITAYRDPDRVNGRRLMQALIDSLSSGNPKPLTELVTLGRTLRQRAIDVLAYFDRPGPATASLRPSTDDSSTYAAPPSASATSPTTSHDHCAKAAASDHDYAVDSDEPDVARLTRARTATDVRRRSMSSTRPPFVGYGSS